MCSPPFGDFLQYTTVRGEGKARRGDGENWDWRNQQAHPVSGHTVKMRVSALRADCAFRLLGCSQTLTDFCKTAVNPKDMAHELNGAFTMTCFYDFKDL
jgi:hypothetical protein